MRPSNDGSAFEWIGGIVPDSRTVLHFNGLAESAAIKKNPSRGVGTGEEGVGGGTGGGRGRGGGQGGFFFFFFLFWFFFFFFCEKHPTH